MQRNCASETGRVWKSVPLPVRFAESLRAISVSIAPKTHAAIISVRDAIAAATAAYAKTLRGRIQTDPH